MALGKAPGATEFMLAAKLVTLGRMVARRRPVTHSAQLGRGEQLELPHGTIVCKTAMIADPSAIPSGENGAPRNGSAMDTADGCRLIESVSELDAAWPLRTPSS
jgi:hypothetical protein